MHAAYARGSGLAVDDAIWHEEVPVRVVPVQVAPRALPQAPPPERSVYGARRSANWFAILAIVLLHGAVLAGLISYKMVHQAREKRAPLVVELLSLPKPAPPAPAPAPPESHAQAVAKPQLVPEIVAPKPLAMLPVAAPSPIVAAPQPPAPATPATKALPASVAPAGPPTPPAPVSVGDLSSRMVAGKPPKYPIESRRKREQGTVILSILVGIDGAVAEIGVSRSSGHDRLDKAALDAVRRWRWTPLVRDGQPVLVRGYVDIPFVLNG